MGIHGDTMLGLLFPGQGSQFVGMGRDLAESHSPAREVFQEADDTLGFALSRLAWEGPAEELTATRNAQPALLTHAIAVYRTLAPAMGHVGFAAGHSLGEFSAYVAAGAMSFADGVRTVRLRGELMYESGMRRPGTMVALLGLDDEAVEGICREASEDGAECVPANYNADKQVVISGDVVAVERASQLANTAGARRVVPLNVSGAFHSPLMEDARMGLARHLETVRLLPARFPVVANVNAKAVRDPETARSLLVDQLTMPVRWRASMEAMSEWGVSAFLELGPGSVLSGLVKRVDRRADVKALGTAEEVESFLSSK